MKRQKLTSEQTAALCRDLALFLHAGISVADGLFLLAREETPETSALLNDLGQALDRGQPMSQAAAESGVFPEYAVGMLRVGERTGRMEECLKGLCAYYEQRHRSAKALRSAVAYPSAIVLLMLGVIGVLLAEVMPVFEDVYASLGIRLAGAAASLLYLGQLLKALLPGLLVLLAVLVVAAVLVCRIPGLRERCAGFINRWFGDRGVLKKFNNARFARALAMGLDSGLPLEESVELAGSLFADNPGAQKRWAQCADLLRGGAELTEAMGKTGFLSASDCRMLSVGLRGGNGDRVMTQIADRLMEDAEESLERTVSRVEPAMVLIASLLVGMILLAVMLPLMNIMSSIG